MGGGPKAYVKPAGLNRTGCQGTSSTDVRITSGGYIPPSTPPRDGGARESLCSWTLPLLRSAPRVGFTLSMRRKCRERGGREAVSDGRIGRGVLRSENHLEVTLFSVHRSLFP